MAKKKKTARQLREEMQQQRKQAFQKQQEQRQEKAAAVRETAAPEQPAAAPEPKRQRKSLAKAAGLKSNFILDPQRRTTVMTAFGRGSTAILEKQIVDRAISDLQPVQQFQVEPASAAKYRLKNSRVRFPNVTADDPLYRRKDGGFVPGMDALRRKNVLEQRFFGRSFADNVHIQMIYSILDIHKILAATSGHIVHLLNIVKGDADRDFLGMLAAHVSYDKLNEKAEKSIADFCKSPRLIYYSAAFYETLNNGKSQRRSNEDIFNILALMTCLRNFSTHHSITIKVRDYSAAGLYNLRRLGPDMKKMLDTFYTEAFIQLNRSFQDHNTTNLTCLFDILNLSDPARQKQLAEEFYRYVVFKEQKNLGFSVRKLREEMLLLPDAAVIADKRYDTCRSKLYNLMDFLILRVYRTGRADRCDKLTEALRAALTDEEKAAVYHEEALSLWNEMRTLILDGLLPQMTPENLSRLSGQKRKGELSLDGAMLKECLYEPGPVPEDAAPEEANAEYFCRMIYLATLFMDGKEINTLLTTLISKFENIAAFLQTMEQMNIEAELGPEYAIFTRSRAVAEQLRVINSFALMKKPQVNAKQQLYRAAVTLLGTEDPDGVTDEMLRIDPVTGKMLPPNRRHHGDTGLRNFIANNVVESRRFQYLIRYSDPAQLHQLASNKKLVRFVLSGIPDTQINRYYETCGQTRPAGRAAKVEFLTGMIAAIRFDQFRDVNQKERGANTQKERYKAMLGLYQTVLYLAVKNLVNINARYVMAFHCVERDMFLYDGELTDPKGSNVPAFLAVNGRDGVQPQYLLLTQLFIQRGYLKRSACEQIQHNMANISDRLLREYRNAVAHLNVIAHLADYSADMREITSYYGLYHYLMQRHLFKRHAWQVRRPERPTEDEEKRIEQEQKQLAWERALFDKTLQYHSYNKDLVKALNAPFGYNLARYKNLSIEQLFSKDAAPATEIKANRA